MASNEAPFPGYGRLQATQLYVCPPREEHADLTEDALATKVVEAANEAVDETAVPHVEKGHVVVVHGDTLTRTSKWLDADGRPVLFFPAERLSEIGSVDPEASVRVYGVIQALLPRHLTVVTFFLRTFLAGNSVACMVSLCTLGPPIATWADVREKLKQYENYRRGFWRSLWRRRAAKVPKSALGARLRRLREAHAEAARGFQSAKDTMEVARLAPYDKKEAREAAKEIERLRALSNGWLGPSMTPQDFRESYSFSMTQDFFGSTECRATIRTLYDRIGTAVLQTLERTGYSIEEYKSDQGRLMINAEKIEHLVVAERIGSTASSQLTESATEKKQEKKGPPKVQKV